MSVEKGDYIGFTIGDYHSSDLGIVRVSSSDRYNLNLLPTISDKTLLIPGGDGTFLFGSFYTQNLIHIDFAFDSLTDRLIRTIQLVLGSKKPLKLIFDEAPYKYYWVKSTGTPQIKYLSFDEIQDVSGTTTVVKVNKGEGTIDLIAYKPYAHSRYKYLNLYNKTSIPEWNDPADLDSNLYVNKNEWAVASGLLESQGDYDTFSNGSILVYNSGDIEADFKLRFDFTSVEYLQYPYYTRIEQLAEGEPDPDTGEIPVNIEYLYTMINAGTRYDSTETYYADTLGNLATVVTYTTPALSTSTMAIFLGETESAATDLLFISDLLPKDGDTYMIINTATNLIEGFDNLDKKTGNIYNEFISAGGFFKLPLGESDLNITNLEEGVIPTIEYDYLYY